MWKSYQNSSFFAAIVRTQAIIPGDEHYGLSAPKCEASLNMPWLIFISMHQTEAREVLLLPLIFVLLKKVQS